MIRTGIVMMLLLAAGPAVAQPLVTVPEGLPGDSEFAPGPDCHGNGVPDLVKVPGHTSMLQPYARDPMVYGGIYLAVEQRFAPLARFFSPGFRCWKIKETGSASPAPPAMAQSRRILWF